MNLYNKAKSIYQLGKRSFVKMNEYKNKTILDGIGGNELIKSKLFLGEPYSIARIGETELSIIREYLNEKKYSLNTKEHAFRNAGIFPNDEKMLNKFSEVFIESLKDIDMLGVWFNKGEGKIINKFTDNTDLVELRSLEPYYYSNPWSEMLKNKKVLVIHPFEDSIISQYKRHKEIFFNKEILPEFKLITIKAIQSISGNDASHKDWIGSLNYMKQEIDKSTFDIAIIGAGAYGLPLAAHIKRMGKISIHMGGATQLLFGIKGARWDKHPFISSLYNEYWVRPNEKEKIKHADKVEGATYW